MGFRRVQFRVLEFRLGLGFGAEGFRFRVFSRKKGLQYMD